MLGPFRALPEKSILIWKFQVAANVSFRPTPTCEQRLLSKFCYLMGENSNKWKVFVTAHELTISYVIFFVARVVLSRSCEKRERLIYPTGNTAWICVTRYGTG